jgi:hypothetical protein
MKNLASSTQPDAKDKAHNDAIAFLEGLLKRAAKANSIIVVESVVADEINTNNKKVYENF